MPRVEIRLDLSRIGQISGAAQDAALETIGLLRGEVVTAQVMPFNTGHMQDKATSVSQRVDGDEIHTLLVTDTPYARRLYHHPEYNFQQAPKNANAQGKWLEPWLPGGDLEGFVPDTFEKRLEARMPK